LEIVIELVDLNHSNQKIEHHDLLENELSLKYLHIINYGNNKYTINIPIETLDIEEDKFALRQAAADDAE